MLISPSLPPPLSTLASSFQIMRMVIQKDGNIKMKDEPMELAREFGGACIILMYSLVLYPLSTVAGVKEGKSKKAM